MAVSVVMPALEMAQETGKLVSWMKKEGEQVKKGEMLLEVETDKAVVEIEAQADGILGGVTAKVGDVVPVGQTIAWLLKPGESRAAAVGADADRPDRRGCGAGGRRGCRGGAGGSRPPPPARSISPKARKLAREHGVDIATVNGSGPGGEILADDILKAAGPRSRRRHRRSLPRGDGVDAAGDRRGRRRRPAAGPADAVSSIGRIMAERTTQSWTTVPHFFVSRDVDATALNAARQALIPAIEQSHGVKVTHTDLLVAAVARALRQHPRMNASWSNGSITLNAGRQRGAGDGGRERRRHRRDSQRRQGDARRHREAAQASWPSARARNRLQPADITGATFTISNLGMFNVDAFTAIIVPPQAGHSRRRRHRRSRRRRGRHDRRAADGDPDAVVRSPGGRRRERRGVPQRRRRRARRAADKLT